MKIRESESKKFEVLQEIIKTCRSADFFKNGGLLEATEELIKIGFVEESGGRFHATEKGQDFYNKACNARPIPDARIEFPTI
jgi:hypothetical protein